MPEAYKSQTAEYVHESHGIDTVHLLPMVFILQILCSRHGAAPQVPPLLCSADGDAHAPWLLQELTLPCHRILQEPLADGR